MAKTSLAVCLMLLVALRVVHGTQGENMADRIFKTPPKMGKDVEPYAYKSMLDFVNEMEGKPTLAAPEFKNLFAKLRDYIDFCFKSASPRSIDFSVEMSRKSEQITMAMSALSGTKDKISMNYWGMILGLVTMEKHVVMMKKIYPKDLDRDQEIRIAREILSWVLEILLFVKEASEMKGNHLDTTSFGLDINHYNLDRYKRYVNDLKRPPFSLPLYLKTFPKRREDFEPFAYKGMSDFLSDLEDKSPGSPDFKEFFANLKTYMVSFKSLTPDAYSFKIKENITHYSKQLFVSMAALNGTKGGTLESWKLVDSLYSMGLVVVEMKRNGSEYITFEELRELTWSIMKWAREINIFVKTASEKKGVSIDLSSFDKYYDSQVLVTEKGARNKTGRGHPILVVEMSPKEHLQTTIQTQLSRISNPLD